MAACDKLPPRFEASKSGSVTVIRRPDWEHRARLPYVSPVVMARNEVRSTMRKALWGEARAAARRRATGLVGPAVLVGLLLGLALWGLQWAWSELGPTVPRLLRVGARGVELESLVVPPGELQGWTIEGSALVFHTLEELVSTGPIADPEGLLEAVLPELERLRAAQREPGPPVPAPMRALVEAAG